MKILLPILTLVIGLSSSGCYQQSSDKDDDEEQNVTSQDSPTNEIGTSSSNTSSQGEENDDTGIDTTADIDAYTAADGTVSNSACKSPGRDCYAQRGWPSACSEQNEYFCSNGQVCISNGENGICLGKCNPDDGCPEIPWGLTAECAVLEELRADEYNCYLTGCTTDDDCPSNLVCTGFARCPDIHTCACTGPDCKTISECKDAPVEGTICYPESC